METQDRLNKLSLPGAIHGTAVRVFDRGVLLLGPSGTGKSTTALELMAFGAGLISDDLVWIGAAPDLILSRPPGQSTPLTIEARGVGLLPADPAPPCALHLVLDLAKTETTRLPPECHLTIEARRIPCLKKIEHRSFPAMILQYLRVSQS